MAVPTFVDRVVLHVAAGRGGNGVASVHREKFKPLGGPDGGNGGPGGSVILRVDPDVTTLVDYHHSPTRKAEHGGHGAGGHRNGAHGSDLVLAGPRRHGRHRPSSGEVLADLVGAGTEIVVAAGGRGGLGNAALASSKRKAPGFALLGEPGDELTIALELKVVADIGLVGFPSAGKSSLIAALSRARPKIADYPFTTLVPNLGVVTAGDTTFTVADVPGLIEGASEGRGLGHDFLRHIERCAALVHVLDMATMEPDRDPVADLDVIETELARYGGLEDRPRLVALNKIDVPDGRDMADIVIDELRGRGLTVVPGLRGQPRGAARARRSRWPQVVAGRAGRPPGRRGAAHRDPAAGRLRDPRLHRHPDRRRAGGSGATSPSAGSGRPTSPTTRPSASSPTGSTGSASRTGCSRWAPPRATRSSSAPRTNSVVFDFKPMVDAGASVLGSRRGEDNRFEEQRPAVRRRRAIDAAYDERGEGEARADVARRADGHGHGRRRATTTAATARDLGPGRGLERGRPRAGAGR